MCKTFQDKVKHCIAKPIRFESYVGAKHLHLVHMTMVVWHVYSDTELNYPG